ncbi:MAG: winged helix-turn-helix domain-containing protein, partial [Acidobacteriota bacterium]
MTSSDPECRRLREEFAVGDWRAHPLEGWIRRGHKTAQLRPKQMELLCFFAVRPGRLLSKEELLEGVWKETVVEDGALTRCLSELRRLLGDNAQNPSYIQTLPRRGYRLIAEVLEQPTPAPPSLRPHVLNASTASEAMPSEPTQSARAAPTAALPKRQRRSLPMAAATTILALSVFLGLRTDGGRAQKKSTPPAELAAENDGRGLGSAGLATPHLAVLEFRYLTGAAELDWLASALPEVLTAELGSAPEANVVPRPAVVAAEQAMSPVALQPEARKHHLRATLGVEGLLTGSYLAAKGAGVIRLDVWLEKSPTAAVEVFSEEGRVEDVLELVSLLGARVRNRLGAPLGTAPAKAAWSHPKAARLFYEGLGMAKRFRARDASELLRESLALDPGQPVAEMALAESLSSRGRRAEALAAVERSLALERPRDRQQRLWIEAGAAEIRRQWDQALERYRALWLMAPDNVEYGLKVVIAELRSSRPNLALETIEELRTRRIQDPRLFVHTAHAHLSLGQPAAALAAA